LVLCSVSEGMPTILPEAMLCRLPIVATPVGGVPEIIRDRSTGLIVPVHDIQALAAAIDALLSDTELAYSLANNAQRFARDNLTWEVNARQMLTIYEDVSQRRIPAGPECSVQDLQRALQTAITNEEERS
jgi:glycosyltransferase involved in cell wall biosynthesis